ncbi:MAG TPA: hypothetical protein PLN69_10820 [bacterium]|nr:hypothetical protein [bacterium]
MNNEMFTRGPEQERRQMLLMSISFIVVGGLLFFLLEKPVPAAVLSGLSLFAFIGFAAYPWVGRGIYLVFALVAFLIGHAVSWLSVRMVYVLAIVIFGAFVRLFGMDRLKKNFENGKKKETNFEESPASDIESFRRQS